MKRWSRLPGRAGFHILAFAVCLLAFLWPLATVWDSASPASALGRVYALWGLVVALALVLGLAAGTGEEE